jgi:hypothetical protein
MELPFRVDYLDAERLFPGAGSKSSLKGPSGTSASAVVGRRVRAVLRRESETLA